jgi:hypothetical protein
MQTNNNNNNTNNLNMNIINMNIIKNIMVIKQVNMSITNVTIFIMVNVRTKHLQLRMITELIVLAKTNFKLLVAIDNETEITTTITQAEAHKIVHLHHQTNHNIIVAIQDQLLGIVARPLSNCLHRVKVMIE